MKNIKIFYEESEENIKLTSHFHNSYELIWVTEGSADLLINSKKYEIHSDCIVFISHLESHELSVRNYPYKRYYILIEPKFLHTLLPDSRLASIFKTRPQNFNHVICLTAEQIVEIKYIFEKMLWEYQYSKDFNDIGLSALLQLLFVNLFRSHSESFPLKSIDGTNNIVHEVQRYIDMNYTEQICLKEISEKFYLDMFYLSHLFKKVCGYSMKDYLILQRISCAKDLLVHSNVSIADICIKSGFGNVNHFIRIFKKKEGLSPLQYRKINK